MLAEAVARTANTIYPSREEITTQTKQKIERIEIIYNERKYATDEYWEARRMIRKHLEKHYEREVDNI